MKIMCAWCNKEIGEKDGGGIEGVSHGICEACSKKLEAGARDRISREDEQEMENLEQAITDVRE